MRFYRVYELNETDSIEDIRLIQAADDAAAVDQARASAGAGTAVEIWDQRRLIGRVISRGQPKAPMSLVAAESQSARPAVA